MTDANRHRRTAGTVLPCALVAVAPPALGGSGSGWRDRLAGARFPRRQGAGNRTGRGRIGRCSIAPARRSPRAPSKARGRCGRSRATTTGRSRYPLVPRGHRRRPEGLRFQETTGSQRRSGLLFPHGDGRSLVFLGGATVNQEPQVADTTREAGWAPAATPPGACTALARATSCSCSTRASVAPSSTTCGGECRRQPITSTNGPSCEVIATSTWPSAASSGSVARKSGGSAR